MIYEVACEKLVLNSGRRVEFSFPGSLATLQSRLVVLDDEF